MNVQAPAEPTEGMLWRAWTALGSSPSLGLDEIKRIYMAVLDARPDKKFRDEPKPVDLRVPTQDQINRAGLNGGLIGHSISDELCPACQRYFLVQTMRGTDCICGHTETF